MRKTSRVLLVVLTLLFCALALVLVGGYVLRWQWTGLPEYQYSIAPDQFYQRQRTLWDWLDLLIVPAALAAGALWLSRSQQKRDWDIAADMRQERVLQEYYDRISDLLIEHGLLNRHNNETAVAVAQALTLSALRSLDINRRVLLIRFLHNAKLIQADSSILSLIDTDFAGAEFHHLYLRDVKLSYMDFSRSNFRKSMLNGANLAGSRFMHANLSGATLFEAILIGTDFRGADMRGADLGKTDASGADFAGADLRGANLSGATLISANFEGAKLGQADLSDTNLSGANLSGVNLVNASFSRAYLFGVDLRGTDTAHATFQDATILRSIE